MVGLWRLLSLHIFALSFVQCNHLPALHRLVVQKNNAILEERMHYLLMTGLSEEQRPLQPALAEYETFKQSADANFIHDGNGKLQYRQFRRINLNSVSVTTTTASHSTTQVLGYNLNQQVGQ